MTSTTTYEIRGGCYIPSKKGFASKSEADAAIRARKPSIVSVEWDDGSTAYYLDQDDADRDQTGERAIALVTQADGEE